MTSTGLSVDTLHHVAADVAEALAKRLSRQSQDLGGLELIGVGELEEGRKKNAIDFALRLCIHVRAPRAEALADEVSEGRPAFVRNSARCTLGATFAER